MSFCEKKFRLRFHESFWVFSVLSSTSYTIGFLLVVHADMLLAIPQQNTVFGTSKQVAPAAETIDSVMLSPKLNSGRQFVYVNDVNPSITQIAKIKQNINNPLNAGKPSGAVSVPNIENRSVLGNSNKKVNEKSQQPSKGKNDTVIFPTSQKVTTRNLFPNTETSKPLIPNEQDIAKCKETGVGGLLCAGLKNYPTNAVRNILNSYSIAVDLLANDSRSEEHNGDTIQTKFDDNDNFKPLCQTTEEFYEPEAGKTVSGQWKFIFQLPEVDKKYIQRIRVEHCKNEGSPCDLFTYAPSGYALRCMQKFVQRRLIAISPDAQPVPDYFLLPSCCVCMYKEDIQLRTSFSQKSGPIPTSATSKSPSAPAPPRTG